MWTRGDTHGAVEDESSQDEVGSFPAELVQQHRGQRGEGEGAEPGPAHCDACGQRPLRLEVVTHADHGRKVDQTEADPCGRHKIILTQ